MRVITPGRLAALREQAGLSKTELARRIGVSTRMVFFYEEGRHTPTPQRLQKIAEALRCDLEELTGVRRGEEGSRGSSAWSRARALPKNACASLACRRAISRRACCCSARNTRSCSRSYTVARITHAYCRDHWNRRVVDLPNPRATFVTLRAAPRWR
ncbi:helix-turn-helix domain-containing protein [Streptomyces coffeae]|uniref:Helix-turn-helix transcriptional regulator n=1 Tax=Streptomyces coffeae TaxID=621382 RepID=A0ABS1NHD8_9ACTN|nr:helix-turn-helix transcriptional regulator [Streptomyces coffeae]